ncbi:biotin carboxylase N-terminal domain-containing protein [Nocardioides dubius]|uniref:Biotin carboxylase N-terminal domain-containing protein n=1 Tax=Nocardioides dubius TaxID=317019 RepID=A0ABP4EBW3_9ACTN
MITRLLVANRGEIARRVFATCARLGIETVAVHSDADAGLPFVGDADVAVRLPGNTPAETYLRTDLILAAAKATGADAIHPGYGFLSENADFARAVTEAGLIWVGPAPESIEQMGSKIESKKLMEAAGVPVLTNHTADTATEADLPLLVKASAGGGGRGMRVVHRLESLAGTIEAAAAEAESAFGDGTVFVEPYVERGRHVEVQVLGHADGVAVFGERDCSVQRRHQKVVEEAPAPNLPTATRSALHEAARAAAAAIDYRGAGTVEFLYDADADRFFFLEMNTRLQVEHPVTELVHGVDLVELQLLVAEGARIDVAETAPRGHAVEVRLYAEDPSADYQPQSGALTRFEIDADVQFGPLPGAGVRLDSGFGTGDVVSTFYDAMLAKLIVWAPTREGALRRTVGALRRAELHGLRTNRDQLVQILGHRDVIAGTMTTALLADEDDALVGLSGLTGSLPSQVQTLLAAALACAADAAGRRPVQRRAPLGWRNVDAGPLVTALEYEGTEVKIGWRRTSSGLEHVDLYDEVEGIAADDPTPLAGVPGAWQVVTRHGGVAAAHRVFLAGERIDVETPTGHVALRRVPRFVDPSTQVAAGSLLAPMPGTVVAVRVAAGETVTEGQPLVVMEAMKMQHVIAAPYDGTVTEIGAAEGDQVEAGAVLAVVSAPDNEAAEGEQ